MIGGVYAHNNIALLFSPPDEYGCDLAVEQPCRGNASLCVALEHVNDGFLDCPDGSDEGTYVTGEPVRGEDVKCKDGRK